MFIVKITIVLGKDTEINNEEVINHRLISSTDRLISATLIGNFFDDPFLK